MNQLKKRPEFQERFGDLPEASLPAIRINLPSEEGRSEELEGERGPEKAE